jgi:hypothetical protein
MRTITMYDVLRQLDRRRFLGFPIWEFSIRSLPRLYGRIFLRDIVLRHPLRTLNGMLAYRRFHQGGRCEGDITHLYDGTEADLREGIVETDGDFLVALGFCQKPLGAPGPGCPAGHFNHDCRVLARDPTPESADQVDRLPIPCRDCDIRAIGLAALQAGAVVYIMTSAADIARHLFIPTLENRHFRYGLFLQCAYSIPAMVLPLLICRIQSLLVGYGTGDCRDYPQFLRADEGTKNERTYLDPTTHARVLDLLHDVATVRRARGQHDYRFRREGPLYVPTGRP